MHGYIGFYNGKQADIYASSLYEAKQKAFSLFKVPKSKQGLLSVHLAEKNTDGSKPGTPVFHSTASF